MNLYKNITKEAYADNYQWFNVLLNWYYNWEIIVNISNKKIKLWFPSIILSDLNDNIIDLNKSINIVINWEHNIPSSYSWKWISMTWTYLYYPKKLQEKLGIYYAWPSSLNYDTNQWNLSKIEDDFNQYDFIILWDWLENISHTDHNNTVSILSNYNWKSFWYVTLSQNIVTLKSKIDLWQATWVKWIFVDEVWYDFLVPWIVWNNIDARNYQNEIIDYIHSKWLNVIFNWWNIDDIFWVSYWEQETHLLKTDWYLFESFVYNVNSNPYYDYNNQLDKITKIQNYKNKYNFDLHCVWMLPLNSDITKNEIDKIYDKSKWLCNSIQITNSNFSVTWVDNWKMINYFSWSSY